MKAMIRFNKGLMGYSRPTQAWLAVLGSMNLLAPLWFIQRPEAQVALLAFLASAGPLNRHKFRGLSLVLDHGRQRARPCPKCLTSLRIGSPFTWAHLRDTVAPERRVDWPGGTRPRLR